jgi:hypothetical protein
VLQLPSLLSIRFAIEIYSLKQERQRTMPGIPIYWDATVPVHGATDSLTTYTFATIPSGTLNAIDDEVTPEEAQTSQCTCCGGIYPLSAFIHRSRCPEPFTNCAICRPQISRVPPPGRTGMQSCSRCGDLLPLAQFIDLARRRQPFKLCPCCQRVKIYE